ncbi:MAG: adenosylcobinamide-GDP ribazoletransferase, partial [Burkholderiales bacterium]
GMWFPVVGFALGALLAVAQALLSRVFPPLLVAALVVALWAALTGGLHLDGLADCCDGLFAAATPERRLEIMRDPRLGAFGSLGLALIVMAKVSTLAALTPSSFLLPFAACLARWLILWVARVPAARPGGMGADFALGLASPVFVVAALLPMALVIIGGWRALGAAALAHLLASGIIRLARARLGGVTGDVFGLTVELAELTTLMTFAAAVPSVPFWGWGI